MINASIHTNTGFTQGYDILHLYKQIRLYLRTGYPAPVQTNMYRLYFGTGYPVSIATGIGYILGQDILHIYMLI